VVINCQIIEQQETNVENRRTEGQMMIAAGKGDRVAEIQLKALWAARAHEHKEWVRKEHGGNPARAILSLVPRKAA
jgi:hypothetical protein